MWHMCIFSVRKIHFYIGFTYVLYTSNLIPRNKWNIRIRIRLLYLFLYLGKIAKILSSPFRYARRLFLYYFNLFTHKLLSFF